ncbi:MAG: hypothetical protein WCI73_02435 [Phycisphaerae bacterium]
MSFLDSTTPTMAGCIGDVKMLDGILEQIFAGEFGQHDSLLKWD